MTYEYISKQRAKDLMGCCLASAKAQYKAEKNEFKKSRYGDYISTIQAMIDVVGAVEAADVQPVKRGEWISCKDRMPKENTLVLCYAKITVGEGNNYFLGAQAHGEFWFLKVNDIGRVSCPVLHWEVTHWQPLPEPPKQ